MRFPEYGAQPEQKENMFAGKHFVITGVVHGIGNALTNEVLARGGQVTGIDIDHSPLTLPQSKDVSKHFKFYTGDVSKEDDMNAIAEYVTQPIDFLILAAGVSQTKKGEIDNVEADTIRSINVGGPLTSFETLLPQFSEDATIVFISSDLATKDTTSLPYYEDSQREIAEFAEQLYTVDPTFRLLTLLPGPVNTELLRQNKSRDELTRVDQKLGIQTPEDLAKIICDKILDDKISYPSNSFIRIHKGKEPQSVPYEVFLTTDEWSNVTRSWDDVTKYLAINVRRLPYNERLISGTKLFEGRIDKGEYASYFNLLSNLCTLPDDTLDKVIASHPRFAELMQEEQKSR